jgi:competence protein ComEC
VGEGGTVTVAGTVVAEPRPLRFGGLGVTLGVDRVTTAAGSWRTRERAGLVLPARTPVGAPGLGDRLVVRAGVAPAPRGDPLGRVPPVELRRADVVSRVAARAPALTVTERVRAAARRVALETLPADRAGLLAGLALGDTSIMPGDVEAAFRAAGLTHLVAVSGANVAIVLAAGLGPLLLAGAGRGATALAGTVIVAAFVVLTRWEPSVLRAGAMAAIGLAGLAAGRGPGGRRALCLAASLLLLTDPALSSALGFVLSVSATAGVLWAGPAVTALLPGWLPMRVRGPVGVVLGAQAGAVGVLALAGAQVPPGAVLANLLAVPLAPAPMLLGLLTALTAPVAPALAAVACALAGPFLAALIAVARWAATLPGAGGDPLTGWARIVPPLIALALAAAGQARRTADARATAEKRAGAGAGGVVGAKR